MLKKNILGILFVVAIITGCATNSDTNAVNIKIEHVSSSSVNIEHTYVTRTKEGLMLEGEIKRKMPHQGRIIGHLHVEIIDENGNILKTAEIKHYRNTNNNRIAKFSTLLPMELTKGRSLRIVHHDIRSHIDEPPTSPWHDIEAKK